jgi:hypothetical protein
MSLFLFFIAFHFGQERPYGEMSGGYTANGNTAVSASVAIASNYVAGLASFGFSISGGLALIAAAIVKPDKSCLA